MHQSGLGLWKGVLDIWMIFHLNTLPFLNTACEKRTSMWSRVDWHSKSTPLTNGISEMAPTDG